eukprot:gene216-943_t
MSQPICNWRRRISSTSNGSDSIKHDRSSTESFFLSAQQSPYSPTSDTGRSSSLGIPQQSCSFDRSSSKSGSPMGHQMLDPAILQKPTRKVSISTTASSTDRPRSFSPSDRSSTGTVSLSNAARKPSIIPHFRFRDLCENGNHMVDYNFLENSDVVLQAAKQMFSTTGIVVIRNAGLENTEMLRFWATDILQNVTSYESAYPTTANVHYHHEYQYQSESVNGMGIGCLDSHLENGSNYFWVSDQKAATQYLLHTKFGKKLRDKGLCYVKCFVNKHDYHGSGFQSWQEEFGVTDKDECIRKLQGLGPKYKWCWGAGDFLRTYFYCDAYEYFPGDGLNYLFSSVDSDSMRFDSWRGVSHLPPMDHPKSASCHNRPLKLFGVGTEFTRVELEQFVALEPGDMAFFCNYRWAHGRPKQDENYTDLAMVLGKKFCRIGQRVTRFPDYQSVHAISIERYKIPN